MIEPKQRCPEEVDIVLVEETLLEETEMWLTGCQICATNATIGLDCLLDALTGCDPVSTEYLMSRPVRCPSCRGEIREKTRVVV